MTKRSSFGNMVRRRLSDITNYAPQHKSPDFIEKLSPDAKAHIERLLKEKMALMKLIQDKDKIIHLSGIEIQKLRNCIQKMQQQNWHLAQSNNLMLAELNMGREKLKALQHEVACKEALLKAKTLQAKVQAEATVEEIELQEPEEITRNNEVKAHKKHHDANRSRRLSRSRSLGGPMKTEKEVVASKSYLARRRRQSAGSRTSTNLEDTENNLFEIDDAKFPITTPSNTPIHEISETPLFINSTERALEVQALEARRTSIGRPQRSSVQKVQSYKERPIKVKLRRSE